jgi:hypothetical protein
VAKKLSDIAPGTQGVVLPDLHDPTLAASIQFMRTMPPPVASASSTPATVNGIVSDISDNSITVYTAHGNTFTTFAISKNTQVISNTLAGEKGKTLSDIIVNKTQVIVNGATTASGTEASTIQILVPLTNTPATSTTPVSVPR